MDISRKRLKARQLVPGMTLLEVSELSFDYATLDSAKLNFIQTAFKGACAVSIGEHGRTEIPIEELREFDHLQEIVAIPETLKIANIVEGLGEMMEKRGPTISSTGV